jgi:hypothetical protein
LEREGIDQCLDHKDDNRKAALQATGGFEAKKGCDIILHLRVSWIHGTFPKIPFGETDQELRVLRSRFQGELRK